MYTNPLVYIRVKIFTQQQEVNKLKKVNEAKRSVVCIDQWSVILRRRRTERLRTCAKSCRETVRETEPDDERHHWTMRQRERESNLVNEVIDKLTKIMNKTTLMIHYMIRWGKMSRTSGLMQQHFHILLLNFVSVKFVLTCFILDSSNCLNWTNRNVKVVWWTPPVHEEVKAREIWSLT